MSKDGAWEKEAARVTSEVARRAIRRLDFLEWIILAATVGLAVGGGALLAWILTGPSDGNFRLVWMIASALLFIVPGVIVLTRHKMDQRKRDTGSEEPRKDETDDG